MSNDSLNIVQNMISDYMINIDRYSYGQQMPNSLIGWVKALISDHRNIIQDNKKLINEINQDRCEFMGLDMYAYIIKKEIVDGKGDFNVPLDELAIRHLGFETKTHDELLKMDKKDQDSYYAERDRIYKKVSLYGLLNKDFGYWRKFYALHDWMENLYRFRGGRDQFNCVNLRLYESDIDRLRKEATNKFITTGTESYEIFDEDYDNIFNFCDKANDVMKDGYAVFYSSWW